MSFLVKRGSHQAVLPALLVMALSAGYGAYFVLRYLGLWSEQDTMRFVQSIAAVADAGSLTGTGTYSHGYGFQVWVLLLSRIMGMGVSDLTQVYLPIVGVLIAGTIAFAAFRKLLASSLVASLGVILLFMVPEFVFSLVRGNHEKLTITLTALALMSLLAGFNELEGRRRWRVLAGWVAGFYVTVHALTAMNAFFGSSFVVASTGAWLFAWVAVRASRHARPFARGIASRLAWVSLTSWVFVALTMFFTYPSASDVLLNQIDSGVQRSAALLLSNEPASDPYLSIGGDWVSNEAYLAVSAFRWVFVASSIVAWLSLVYRFAVGRHLLMARELLLASLFTAFALQVGASMLVDQLGLSAGSNLQVRLYAYFAIVGAPMLAHGTAAGLKWVRTRYRPWPVAFAPVLVGLALFAVLSLAKTTLDPLFANRWLSYTMNEVTAVKFWDSLHAYQALWVGSEPRLRHAYFTLNPDRTGNGNSIGSGTKDAAPHHAVASQFVMQYAVARTSPLPTIMLENRVYDNGGAQIVHRVARTPFQH